MEPLVRPRSWMSSKSQKETLYPGPLLAVSVGATRTSTVLNTLGITGSDTLPVSSWIGHPNRFPSTSYYVRHVCRVPTYVTFVFDFSSKIVTSKRSFPCVWSYKHYWNDRPDSFRPGEPVTLCLYRTSGLRTGGGLANDGREGRRTDGCSKVLQVSKSLPMCTPWSVLGDPYLQRRTMLVKTPVIHRPPQNF